MSDTPDTSFRCVDRVPDLMLTDRVADVAAAINPANRRPNLEAAGTCFWRTGTTLRVWFLDGDAALQARVLAVAQAWSTHADLRFTQVNTGPAEIRVTFHGDGNWSALGTQSMVPEMFAPAAESMCLDEVRRATPKRFQRVVLHEFGHAIGLVHEHSSPASGMNWNKPVVYAALAKPPNRWTEIDVELNVFHRYAATTTQFTEFDPDSIMLYTYPPSWTLDGRSFPENHELSATDARFVREIYPAAVI